ncbi:MAG: hypothetical protein U9Q22_00355 [Candidatus Altiarchaeota archaeon]|nr:hypothetical protein [Candidatus Altiarchaeota archaeon]
MDSKIAYWSLIVGIGIYLLGFPTSLILSYVGYEGYGLDDAIRGMAYLIASLGFFTAAFFSKESDVIRAAMMLVGGILLRLF